MNVGVVVAPLLIGASLICFIYMVLSIYKKKIKPISFLLAFIFLLIQSILWFELSAERRAMKTMLLADDDGLISTRTEFQLAWTSILASFIVLVIVSHKLYRKLRPKETN